MKHSLKKHLLQFVLFLVVFAVAEAVVCLATGRPLFGFSSLTHWQRLLVIVLAVSVNELLVCFWARRNSVRKRKEMDDKYGKLFDEAGL